MAKWNADGAAGARADGYAKRTEVTRAVWESLGGTVECVYYAPPTSEWDVVTIVDGLSSDDIYAVGVNIMASGAMERVGAIELRTGEEADATAAREIPWRRPGQA